MSTTPSAGRPTLRMLGALAGVSAMTVSLALRNHPSLPAATRQRLRKLAAAHGYRPDPAVTKLMHHLRTNRGQRRQATLCGLCLRAPPGEHLDYGEAVLAGARARAESLGFGLDLMAIDEPGLTPRRLERILVNRGIAGLLLLPMREPVHLARLLDWSQFSAVAATPSVLSPRLNEAMPDLFGNMLLLCRELAARGCRRIGLAPVAEHDVRVNHRVLAPFLWHSQFGGGDAVPPLLIPAYDPEPALVRSWIARHRPDAIISNGEFTVGRIDELLTAHDRRRIVLASTTLQSPGTARFAGILDNGFEVGAAAVEMLAAAVQRGETGLPETPRTTLIGGRFFAPKPRAQAAHRRRPPRRTKT
ncbi:MAG TPA: LacI family DNA-binding transcriptional regulator [Opitutus sp.]|nr:LacI family DNA-binding transcriptional regulator [Opitutus sp.]